MSQAHLVDLVFEAQDFGEGVEDVDGEAFISLRLPQDVLCHHDKRIFLQRGDTEVGVFIKSRQTCEFRVSE